MFRPFRDIRCALSQVFNWKKHPASVFAFALPLAVIGLGSMLTLAFIHAQEGRYGYLAIWFAIVTLGVIALIPAYRMHKTIQHIKEQQQHEQS